MPPSLWSRARGTQRVRPRAHMPSRQTTRSDGKRHDQVRLQQPSKEAEETIRALQAELAETNRGSIALTWELEQRVDERTAQLRAAHDELQRTNAELMQLTIDLEDRVAQRTESEEKFRNLAETASDAILSADSHGKIVYFNPAAERIFSYSSTEIIGQPLTLLMPERFHDPHRQGLDRFLRTGEARIIGKTIEVAARRKNGSEFPIELALSSWKTREGTFFTAILSDITMRKKAEEHLVQMVAELKRSNDELQQFAYVASHDLQEPLRMVASYTQLLAERYKGRLDSDADEFITYAVDGSNRMQALIQDLLAYSRAGTNGKALREISSENALKKALTNLRATIQESGAVVTHDSLPAITTDDTQLVQVFQNLVGNAIKYRSAEVPHVHVCATKNGGQEWIFSVRDNGLGIDPQYFERIFILFQRLHGQKEFKGTGIGLTICKKMLERLGGRIWVESQPEKGSTFYFALPERAGK
jgi:PAS domain S-box-containing protein